MEPHARVGARVRNRRHRIDGGGRGSAYGCDDSGRVGQIERRGVEAELVVDRNLARLEPKQPRRALDGRMRLL